MSNRRNIQFTFNPHNKATVLDCNFIVDHTNGNGFGIRSLKPSGRIATVFMNTNQTPGTASNGQVNPNPIAGLIVVTLQDNYNRYLGGYSGMSVALSGSNITSGLTAGHAYVITSLGSSTAAQWQTAGVPSEITPAVGVSFIAAATSIAGGGAVQAISGSSGIDHIEIVGDPNTMNSNTAGGMQLILACYSAGVLTAPADNTVIGLNFYMNDTAQGV
jgi:hypothetical protein